MRRVEDHRFGRITVDTGPHIYWFAARLRLLSGLLVA